MAGPVRMEELSVEPDGRRSAPSARRNRVAILAALEQVLPRSGTVLEVASGTGEHAAFLAEALPGLTWIPTDRDEAALASIRAWRVHTGQPNLRAPLRFDVAVDPWLPGELAAVVAINFLHIAPWSATLALLDGAAAALVDDGVLFFYGAMLRGDDLDAPSNLSFDRRLRELDPSFGVRRLAAVAQAARDRGLRLQEVLEMPNNNLGVVLGWP